MVSGLVTSPEDQSRICLLDASPIRMASNSLMSIKSCRSFFSFLCLYVGQLVSERTGLGLSLFLRVLFRCNVDVRQVTELFVGRQGQLAGLVDPLLARLGLLGGRVPRRRPERPRR